MALVEWKEAYTVNIIEIDTQHKKLVDLINELHAALISGTGTKVLNKILNDLVNYTLYHFDTEEKFFDLYEYPESAEHKKAHKDLVQQVAALQKKHNDGEKVLTIDVMNFLRDWLQDHIVGTDKKFGPFLNSKGVF
ncbi:MAG: hemerythrin family protein [Candidatus Marinimicrobia bacterium]|jgi:hemerythrin|nr:hemerythrin family protein [Candidatus Neomarinimicrobiota bacterium]MBT3683436.1 hemerythrin family protein [Candidatus Neomarinimicrobiota bacterium]MBT3760324.1 hemerythrin family protein [Candidatus Neomarinimicrobiota bacterium]MBT3896419.1 hemerythrin family protein [Candidatus Neomarinimicrobiota bacterium]MBT4173465.1 hemerythrin family protein [Candidatus Neomarinimicrobiota bacterium]